MSSRMRVHLFGPGSILKLSEPQGKKTVSGELQSKADAQALCFSFWGFVFRSRMERPNRYSKA